MSIVVPCSVSVGDPVVTPFSDSRAIVNFWGTSDTNGVSVLTVVAVIVASCGPLLIVVFADPMTDVE